MSRKQGDTWVNSIYSVTARINDEGILLATSNGRTFWLTQQEAVLLSRAINKRWPLDALSQIS